MKGSESARLRKVSKGGQGGHGEALKGRQSKASTGCVSLHLAPCHRKQKALSSTMSFSPRRVRITPTVALYECRLLKCAIKTSSLLRHVEQRLKKWRGVQRWSLQCYCSPRGEVVVQAVVERAAVASRVDNLLQAWRKIVVKMLPGVVQAKQLKRGVWFQDTLVDVRVMVESWEAACAKLGAEAAVDGSAAKCTYLEPALPSAGAPNTAPPAPRAVAEPRSLPAPEPRLQLAPEPRLQPAPEQRPQPAPSQRSSVPQSQQVPEKPHALLVTLG